MLSPSLYLIPVELGDTPQERVLPSYNREVILGIRHFIVEEVRSARRFLKRVDRDINIDELTFYPMGKHADASRFSEYLRPSSLRLVVQRWPTPEPTSWPLPNVEVCESSRWWGLRR